MTRSSLTLEGVIQWTTFTASWRCFARPSCLDESLDYDSLRRLADYVVDEGAHAVVCLGLASETNRLSEEEKQRVVKTVVAQVGDRVPVISGLQAASTVEAVRQARWLVEAGVVGLMVLPPPGPVDAEGVSCSSTRRWRTPSTCHIMVQDCPQVVGYGLTAGMIAQMAERCSNIQYVKLEAQPAWPLMEALREQSGDRLAMLVGWGGIGFIEALERGAVGCMPGADAIGPMAQVYERYLAGDIEGARAVYAVPSCRCSWRKGANLADVHPVRKAPPGARGRHRACDRA